MKRYDPAITAHGQEVSDMEPDDRGEWVLYHEVIDEIVRRRDQIAALKDQVESLETAIYAKGQAVAAARAAERAASDAHSETCRRIMPSG